MSTATSSPAGSTWVSLFLSPDPVALDTVMLDHIRDELKQQGPAVPAHVVEWASGSTFLE